MSVLTYIASNYPLEEIKNPHEKLLSVNEAIRCGIKDIPDFLLDSDFDRDKPGVVLYCDRDIEFDLERGKIIDGGFDDDFSLFSADGMDDVYTEKKYTVELQWNCFTEGRAERVIEYIRENLRHTDEVEMWHIWMGIGEMPIVRSKTVGISQLKPDDIRVLMESDLNAESAGLPIQYRIVIKAE
ncbi:MAG: hypothetical protein E7672_00230 [Ruminococcaceae bacterium]|nr:hypothetical protein [Oscillospiraceae bacterium]